MNPLNPSQELPTLLQLLHGHYKKQMELRNEQLKKQNGADSPQINVAEELSKLATFMAFSHQYLNVNRPSQIQHADANFVIVLSNMDTFVVCPNVVEVRGAMQQSNAVAVTGQHHVQDLGKAASWDNRMMQAELGDGVHVSNPFRAPSAPAGMGSVDYSQQQAMKDMTLPTPQKSYDKTGNS